MGGQGDRIPFSEMGLGDLRKLIRRFRFGPGSCIDSLICRCPGEMGGAYAADGCRNSDFSRTLTELLDW